MIQFHDIEVEDEFFHVTLLFFKNDDLKNTYAHAITSFSASFAPSSFFFQKPVL